jgi:hypothetical protein
VASPAGAKSVTDSLEPCFPEWFQGVFHHGLNTPIHDGGNAERPLAFALRNINPTNRADLVKIELAKLIAKSTSFLGCRHYHVIDTGGVLTRIHLGDPTNAFQHIRLTPQHQSLKRPDTFQIAFS